MTQEFQLAGRISAVAWNGMDQAIRYKARRIPFDAEDPIDIE
jgi:hypothetical protein